MRWALACAVLAGCTPVARWTSPAAITAVAPALRRDGSATLPGGDVAPGPPDKAEPIRLDQRVAVRLAARAGSPSWIGMQAFGAEQTMPLAELFADCPPDLTNDEASWRAYPRCKLFRTTRVRLRTSYRADRPEILVVAGFLGAGAALACLADCPSLAQTGAGIALGVGVGAGLVALVIHAMDAIANDDHKH